MRLKQIKGISNHEHPAVVAKQSWKKEDKNTMCYIQYYWEQGNYKWC